METKARQRRSHTDLRERRLWVKWQGPEAGCCLVLWRRVKKAGPRRGGRNEVPEEEKQLGEGLGGMGLADSSTESSRGRCTDMPPPP